MSLLLMRGARKSGFTPTDIAGLQLWLKADAIVGLNDGDAVGTWTASTGPNATQATASKKPTYKTAIQNSKPVVRFDGTSDTMSLVLSVAAGSLSFFFAVAPPTVGQYAYLFDSQTGRLVVGALTDQAGKAGWYDGAWHSIANAAAGFQILSLVLTSGGNGQLWRNGSSLGTAAYTEKAIGDAVTLGSDYTSASWVAADIGEVLIYNSALSAANRAAVESYLNQRWAVY